MMVTFVSQCEKKALNKTRHILDTFANRIGDNTWQTVITNEGLQTIKKLLRKTASKNTAVSCHWMKSRNRSEVVWIVGNQNKFSSGGYAPVNTTEKNITNTQWEDDWHYLPLIKALTALAALFHDWGKASELFQCKLMKKNNIAEPLRHEWISLLFFSELVQDQSDEVWLSNLMEGKFDIDLIKGKIQNNKKPFNKLSNAATSLGWLIVSHHRLPLKNEGSPGSTSAELSEFLKRITQTWSYQNKSDDYSQSVARCFNYPNGLPIDSKAWLKEVRKQARKLHDSLPLLKQSLKNGCWRAIILHSRLCLMLGDHYYSSLKIDSKYRLKQKELTLLANTDQYKKPKQTLDEHLLGVCKQALRNAHFLPFFEGKTFNGKRILQQAENLKTLKKRSDNPDFIWQDNAVDAIKKWRKNEKNLDNNHFGFFAVNMASTGKGKTFANAKIMQALSLNGSSLRYVLALGLRTLTLQTGDEYRKRIGLQNEDLAVLIGSHATSEFHSNDKEQQNESVNKSSTGSESEESLLDNELDFDPLPYIDESLKTMLHTSKQRQFLYAPVLACTIDQMIAATETKRGNRYILPTLRLMHSDLVIDEIDYFDGTDLIAIGRLIHLAGMLGRKVMISSATIPPDMAEGYFNVYQSGWNIFSTLRNKSPIVGCAWVDEFETKIKSVPCNQITTYQSAHNSFISKRLQSLKEQTVKRKSDIVPLKLKKQADDKSLQDYFFTSIKQAITRQHTRHATTDSKTGINVSFGVVRIANIRPCIQLTRYLLNANWGKHTEIRTMAYHSQQVLIMRNEQEKHLDTVLKRKKGNTQPFSNQLIRQHLSKTKHRNLIFILVATSVEEVGRDHDFDWAVVEPSSYRSIIQLTGHILRHQKLAKDIEKPNVEILQYNLKGLLNKNIAFNQPGHESEKLKLETKNIKRLLDVKMIAKNLDASPRITRNRTMDPLNNLADLEHKSIHHLLTHYHIDNLEDMQPWLNSHWWLTAMPQERIRFRQSSPSKTLFLTSVNNEFRFVEKDNFGNPTDPVEHENGIQHEEELNDIELSRLWLKRDYKKLLESTKKSNIQSASMIFGELNMPTYDGIKIKKFTYISQLGLLQHL